MDTDQTTGSARLAIVGRAVDANSTREFAPATESTGLRTSGLRYRSVSSSERCSRIAEEFLLNTRNVRDDRETEISILHYYDDSSTEMLSLADQVDQSGLRSLALPKSVPLRMALGEAIGKRRSRRLYTGDPLPLDYLATIIRAASGLSGEAEAELNMGQAVTLRFRTTPSGGRLYPVQLYAAAINVTGLPKAVYRYDPLPDSICEVAGAAVVDQLLGAVATSADILPVQRANVLFLFIAKPWRAMRKYGPRGMRFVFLDSGYMAQNIHLATTGLGYGSVDCASLYDDEAHEALGIDGLYETLVHAVIVGCS